MTVSCGTNIPRRRSVFNLWNQKRVTPLRSKPYPSPADSVVSDSPVSPVSLVSPNFDSRGSRARFGLRFTQSGSKFLFLLGLGTSSNSESLFTLISSQPMILSAESQATRQASTQDQATMPQVLMATGISDQLQVLSKLPRFI